MHATLKAPFETALESCGAAANGWVRYWHLADIDLDPVHVRFRG